MTTKFPGIGSHIMKIKWSPNYFIFIKGIGCHLYIQTAPVICHHLKIFSLNFVDTSNKRTHSCFYLELSIDWTCSQFLSAAVVLCPPPDGSSIVPHNGCQEQPADGSTPGKQPPLEFLQQVKEIYVKQTQQKWEGLWKLHKNIIIFNCLECFNIF